MLEYTPILVFIVFSVVLSVIITAASYVLGIKRKNPTEESTKNDAWEFTVTFSEAVENVSSSDFVSVSDATFTMVKENDASYVITVGNITDYYGAVSLNVKSGTTIQDKTGNLLLNAVTNVHQN